MEMEKLILKINELELKVNKKEDDLKNIINEKDIIIEEMNNKLLQQEKIIKDNKCQIENMNKRIEEIFKEFNEFKNKVNIFEKNVQEKENKDKMEKKKFQKRIKPILSGFPKIELDKKENTLNFYLYPSKKISNKKYYTLLLLGEIGVGKTTLMDAFVNYMEGIEFEDEFRYKLTDEKSDGDYNKSQTKEITSYFLNYSRDDKDENEINIRIIDTPGIGIEDIFQDDIIIKKYKKLFKEIGELDYILFSIKSSTSRITSYTQFILDRIQIIFGKDLLERFMLMCTFSDAIEPMVLNVLKYKHFIYQDYFQFNNSCLYNYDDYRFIQFFWNLGNESIQKLFNIIKKKKLPPLSLNLSIQVIEKREKILSIEQNLKDKTNQINKNNILEIDKSIKKDIESIKALLKELDIIALKPGVLINEELLELLIEKEKIQKKPRWSERYKKLEEIKKIYELIKN